jgi:tetratricopeptide (TPR) repeat protein
MKKSLLFFFVFFISINNAQEEKRLALVIGNANYDKGALKNPVNDALLIAKTLESLNFDVILDTNLKTKRAFRDKITEFGNRRPNYDVAIVYYAGHGVQVKNENFLLPTKEEFSSEYDVEDFGVSVQMIIRYLTAMTNQVNVLILDACRDNPFESNWGATRSLKGSGLAKMQAPSGSMIAFSTTAGNTAPDGEGNNSTYCQSLSKNMLIEGINLDQVFRNTRSDVMNLTNGLQMTEESTQLTGETFYLKKFTFQNELIKIDSLIIDENYMEALEICSSILKIDKKNKEALYKKGRIYALNGDFEKAIKDYNLAIEYYPNCSECFRKRGYFYNSEIQPNEPQKAILDFNTAIELDPLNWKVFSNRAFLFLELGNFDNALKDFNKCVQIAPNNWETYYYRTSYYEQNGDYDKAFEDYKIIIKLRPNDPEPICDIADFSRIYLEKPNLAINFYKDALSIDSTYYVAIHNLALTYEKLKKYNEALKFYKKTLNFTETPYNISLTYRNIGDVYSILENHEKAIENYNQSIKINSDDDYNYFTRGLFYFYQDLDYLALDDFNQALNKDPENLEYLFYKSQTLYSLNLFDQALQEINKAILIDSTDFYALTLKLNILNTLENYEAIISVISNGLNIFKTNNELSELYNFSGKMYLNLENYSSSLLDFKKAIEYDNNYYEYYLNIANIYTIIKDYDKALINYNKALSLDSENTDVLNQRGLLFSLMDNHKKSEKDFNKSIKTDSNSTAVYFYKAKAHMIHNQLLKAEEDYLKTINIDPDDPEGYFYLAELCTKEGKLFKAAKNYHNAISKVKGGYYISDDKGNKTLKFKLFLKIGDFYNKIGEQELMCDEYKEALKAADGFPEKKKKIEALIKANCN